MKKTLTSITAQTKWTALTVITVLLLFICIFAVTGCSNDEEPLESYKQALCELVTDASGRSTTFRYDDGRTRPVQNPYDKLTPDSVYRVLAYFVDDETAGVKLATVYSVVSPLPVKMKDGEMVKTDPVKLLTTMTRSPRYINAWIGVPMGNLQPTLGFVERGVTTNSNGTQTLELVLYHNSKGVIDSSYSQELLISCPVYPYTKTLRAGTDSVALSIQTSYGLKRGAFLY